MAVYFCLPICPFVQILSRYSGIVGGGGGGGEVSLSIPVIDLFVNDE